MVVENPSISYSTLKLKTIRLALEEIFAHDSFVPKTKAIES